MALLTPEDLEDLSSQFEESESIIERVTGNKLADICKELYGKDMGSEKVGIIPITAGNGIISNFTSSLLFIAQRLGLEGFITQHTDVAGYYEAIRDGADILLMADDHLFIAHNLRNGKLVTNHEATGIIYSEIASRFKDASSNEILVIGLGRVGYAGAKHLTKKGFNVYACDPNRDFLEKAVHELGIMEYCKEDHKKFSMVFEATPNANTITEGMIAERCLVSTPGIPCGLPQEVGRKHRVDLVMEPLLIGVTSMLYSVI
ncbi:MAG: 3-methylornithyl-N6-L-lysine dehydrogenase PylD [Methanomethylovorans sp.]|uniref:3-methylornithyl-N6-L-lysine dehydrogenase PylD n=1 Tax=Methanomethylovorans sp. TaxID=2758717 RepID=UPI003C776A9D